MFQRKDSNRKLSVRQDALAQKIANGIVSRQRDLATFLNRRTAHFSMAQKQALLVAISVFFGGICLFLIFTANL